MPKKEKKQRVGPSSSTEYIVVFNLKSKNLSVVFENCAVSEREKLSHEAFSLNRFFAKFAKRADDNNCMYG